MLQAGYGNVWPSSEPDPSILAAYNAALESLRSRPPFPSFSASPSSSGASAGGESLPNPAGDSFSRPADFSSLCEGKIG